MTEAMPFLRKLILLSYDPRPSAAGIFLHSDCHSSPIDSKDSAYRSHSEQRQSPVPAGPGTSV